ncbi:MAG TPA: hypothetical protein VJ768_00585 [Anaerolineales bacterium]|nr:hypothetical protein [Anaerolineales bacterium]
MKRQSQRFEPGKLSRLLVPLILALLTLALIGLVVWIVSSLF